MHELLALELCTLLLTQPTDDSVEVAIEFIKECGYALQDLSPQGSHGIFERFRGILHEGEIDKRTQFMIEGLFAFRKSGFEGKKGVPEELDLVDEDDQIVHEISLDDELEANASLDVFKFDPNYEENEKKYSEVKKEILCEESSSSDELDSDDDDDDESGSDNSSDDEPAAAAPTTTQNITDATETNLVNLRRTIYLTIMSSLDFEEAGHKLMQIQLQPGQEIEVATMLVECCSQERTFVRYYGLLAQRFCFISKEYASLFDDVFMKQFSTIHRLETNKLRNVAKFFAHLLATDAMSWTCLAYIQLSEDTTTSASRIFIKILFQELSEQLGLKKLNEKMSEEDMQEYFTGVMPKAPLKNVRFSINFFTSIGLGGLTDRMREHLKKEQEKERERRANASSSSSFSSSSSSSSSSDSDSSSSSSSDSSSSGSSSSGSSSSSSSQGKDRRRRRKRKSRK